MNRRPGFTLVETIVALVVLQIAMLALAATAGLAARNLADAVLRRRAYAVAADRVESLRAGACSSQTAGSHIVGPGMVEHWRTDALGSARSISDSVSIHLSRGVRSSAVARAWVLCGA